MNPNIIPTIYLNTFDCYPNYRYTTVEPVSEVNIDENNHIYIIPPTLDTLLFVKGNTNKISPQHGVGLSKNFSLLLDITDDLSTIVPKF